MLDERPGQSSPPTPRRPSPTSPLPLVAPPPLHTPDSSSLYFRVWDMFICLKKRYVPIGVKSWGVNPVVRITFLDSECYVCVCAHVPRKYVQCAR